VFHGVLNVGQGCSRLSVFRIDVESTTEAPSSIRISLKANQRKAEVQERLFAASLLASGRAQQHSLGLSQTTGSVKNPSEHDAVSGIRWTDFHGSAIPWLHESSMTLPFVELSKVEVHHRPLRAWKKSSGTA